MDEKTFDYTDANFELVMCNIPINGKKWSAIFGQAASYCIGYSLITFAVNVECIYAGRFFCGICQVSE